MTTAGFILVLAVLILGGLIAVLGDRLGSKIGKKRLRLFNLRPRDTAIVMTISTGVVIAASTLGLLFGLSKPLRQGVFELDKLMEERRAAIKQLEKDLTVVREQKTKIEQQLDAAKKEQSLVQTKLTKINKQFKESRSQLGKVSQQLTSLKNDIEALVNEREQLLQQRNQLSGQIAQLQNQINQRDQELAKGQQKIAQQNQILAEKQARLFQIEEEQKQLQAQINTRDEKISNLDNQIAARDKALLERATKLKDLEAQLTYLKREVEVLEQYYQTYQELRESKIAILKGQLLSFGAFRLDNPDQDTLIGVVDQLLREANRAAIAATRPDNTQSDERVVKITRVQVEQLIQQLQTSGEYVVRILSAGNYVLGEKEVRVFADVVPNQKIFEEGQKIAAVSIDLPNLTEAEIQSRLDLLLSASQFRARRLGVLGQIQIEDGSLKRVIKFIEAVNSTDESLDELQALAAETTYTAGPLKIRLVAMRNGKIVFST